MKKTLSIFLAIFMIFVSVVPAFAAEKELVGSTGEMHTVEFRQPSKDFEGAYKFVNVIDGEVQFREDPDGEYVFFDNRYMTMDNIYPSYQHQVTENRYSPVEHPTSTLIYDGEAVFFKVLTSKKYNIHTVTVRINGEVVKPNVDGYYAILVKQDLVIEVAETDENGDPYLLKSHYNVKLVSDEGYKVKTLKNENYRVVYYGGSFDFRVEVLDGFTAPSITVTVQRGNSDLSEILGEDLGSIDSLFVETEELISYGIDADGCRLYRIENITTDCTVLVSGVEEESSTSGIMSLFKRIIRLIANLLKGLFGIELDILDSITAYYNIEIDNTLADTGVTYRVINGNTKELSPTAFTVTGGEGVTVIVTKRDVDQDVNVKWNLGNADGTYKSTWIIDNDSITGKASFSAIYTIDNINADTQITIY